MCFIDAKKIDSQIFYLVRKIYCGEFSEVTSQSIRMNWPNLLLEYLEEKIIWIRGGEFQDNPSEIELRFIPNETPSRISCMCVNIKVFLNEFQYFPVFLYIFQMWLTQVAWSIVWSLETVAFLWQPLQPKTDGQCWSSIFWKIIWFSIKLIQKTIPSNPKQSIMKNKWLRIILTKIVWNILSVFFWQIPEDSYSNR